MEEETKSKRLLIFFSLAFRVTALFVYDSISLHLRQQLSVVIAPSHHKYTPMLAHQRSIPVSLQHTVCVSQFEVELYNLLQRPEAPG